MKQTISIDTIEQLLEASPSRLIVMLYDETIRRLEAAIEAVASGDIEMRCSSVNRAIEIVCHLYLTLDLEQGGDVAEKLSAIYRFLLGRLPRVNLDNDAEPAREAIRLLAPVRQSWTELDDRIEASIAASQALVERPGAVMIAG
jgi:flagellar protein FliS